MVAKESTGAHPKAARIAGAIFGGVEHTLIIFDDSRTMKSGRMNHGAAGLLRPRRALEAISVQNGARTSLRRFHGKAFPRWRGRTDDPNHVLLVIAEG
jgi:hypothetical protein